MNPYPIQRFATFPIFLVMGAIVGLIGVAYNYTLLGALASAERLGRWLSGDMCAAMAGAAVGLLAWFGPGLVGGGDAIMQRALAGNDRMLVVAAVFLVRFGLWPLSYAAGTPGGLFAPMLVVESQSGLVLGTLFCGWFPYLAERPAAFAVVGMAAFFIAVVRAPVTGILLVTEMPGMIKHDHRRPEMLFGQKPFMFRLQAQAIRDGILKGPAGGIENGDRIGVGKSLERAFSHESEPCDQCFIHKLGKQGQFIRAVYEIGQRGRLANFWFPST